MIKRIKKRDVGVENFITFYNYYKGKGDKPPGDFPDYHRAKSIMDNYFSSGVIAAEDVAWLLHYKRGWLGNQFKLDFESGKTEIYYSIDGEYFPKDVLLKEEPDLDEEYDDEYEEILTVAKPEIDWEEVHKFFLGMVCTEFIKVLKGEVEIQRCKRNDCNNIFLKSGKREYCSDECSYEAKLENDREAVRQEAAKVYKTLCDLIDKWLKQDSREITATELKEELKKIAKGSYIPFLGGVTAKSLGRLLPQVEEKLKEKGILIEIKKRKKGYLYRFTRIQS